MAKAQQIKIVVPLPGTCSQCGRKSNLIWTTLESATELITYSECRRCGKYDDVTHTKKRK